MATGFTSTTLPRITAWRQGTPLATSSRVLPFQEAPTSLVSQSSAPVAEVRHLRKSYGDHLAVKDVSFSLQRGEILGLLGPNGAGKSTTMMMLAGLLSPTSGEVLLNGQKFDGRNHDQRRLLGVVPQEYAIYQELNAIDNLMFFGKLYGLRGQTLKNRCDEVLEQIGLADSAKRTSGNYSGGMKRRLNFGVALMHKPAILILDEPTVGVDPQSRSHLLDCIRRQAGEGVGIVYASHYMEEVQSLCQRVAIVDHGEVLANDSISNLLGGTSSDICLYVHCTAGIADAIENLAILGTGSDGEPAIIVPGDISPIQRTTTEPPLRCGVAPLPRNTSSSFAELSWRLQTVLFKLGTLGIRIERIETQQSNLERLFLQLTGKRLRD